MVAVDRYCTGPAERDLRLERGETNPEVDISCWREVGGSAHRWAETDAKHFKAGSITIRGRSSERRGHFSIRTFMDAVGG